MLINRLSLSYKCRFLVLTRCLSHGWMVLGLQTDEVVALCISSNLVPQFHSIWLMVGQHLGSSHIHYCCGQRNLNGCRECSAHLTLLMKNGNALLLRWLKPWLNRLFAGLQISNITHTMVLSNLSMAIGSDQWLTSVCNLNIMMVFLSVLMTYDHAHVEYANEKCQIMHQLECWDVIDLS